jgi:large subunit ribosomal protein LP1
MGFTVSDSEKQELLVTYAALILFDDKVDITAENILKLVAAAGAEVEPYWPKLMADLLKGQDVAKLLLTPAMS